MQIHKDSNLCIHTYQIKNTSSPKIHVKQYFPFTSVMQKSHKLSEEEKQSYSIEKN